MGRVRRGNNYCTLTRLYDILDELPQEPNTGCKIWEDKVSTKGYGLWGSKHTLGEMSAHRHVLTRKLGRPILPGRYACHSCDTPSCVEESHIFEGTSTENVMDMLKKGRTGSKLTPVDILDIRARRAAGEKLSVIASRYQISIPQTCGIVNRKTWSHVL